MYRTIVKIAQRILVHILFIQFQFPLMLSSRITVLLVKVNKLMLVCYCELTSRLCLHFSSGFMTVIFLFQSLTQATTLHLVASVSTY